jgi:hypothetical protein
MFKGFTSAQLFGVLRTFSSSNKIVIFSLKNIPTRRKTCDKYITLKLINLRTASF